MRNKRSAWVLLVLVLVGALIGGVLGEILSRYTYFSWMSLGGRNGYRTLFAFSLDPAVDFHVLRFGFSMSLKINAGSLIGMVLGILLYAKI